MSTFFGNTFGLNPFGTQIGAKIELATNDNSPSENWSLNMDICDLINQSEDGPKDAIRAIKRRLSQNVGKNYTIILLTLTVLETCVKNCGQRFHLLVCQKDFITELKKLLESKNDPPTAVQDKVLTLIQSWADAFGGQVECTGIQQMYDELLAKGIDFSTINYDSDAPIHTPKRSVVPPIPSSTLLVLTSEQRCKLQQELEIVQNNMILLGEMLNESDVDNSEAFDLVNDLYTTCCNMQKRLSDLIIQLSHDEFIAELLRINDDLISVFTRYDHWKNSKLQQHSNSQSVSASAMVSKVIPPSTSGDNTKNLIDFTDKDQIEGLSKNVEKLSTSNTEQSTTTTTTNNRKETEREVNEMANWLDECTDDGQESLTSTEFERFLEERATAVAAQQQQKR